ncbi:uncharacterized protein LY89DRAFT_662926 [Mollisia scopiformis]|uniref:2EXR domain-containing protein n=1 Tax=Mollisia scopiformis TaxID=149040 RepID=A0A194XVX6_MOLSC|nr:uncharacterized protein LY89DRAFT_662926 [Mollisia scopiformis]KUJ24169.1 hypothetical protein LY89DRAFT_662926 [Mollisia scopiformis]
MSMVYSDNKGSEGVVGWREALSPLSENYLGEVLSTLTILPSTTLRQQTSIFGMDHIPVPYNLQPVNKDTTMAEVSKPDCVQRDAAAVPTPANDAHPHTSLNAQEVADSLKGFAKLAPELTQMIFELMTIDDPRIIEVLWNEEKGFYTNAEVPTVLHICSQSRSVAQRVFSAMVLQNCKSGSESPDGLPDRYDPKINKEGPYTGVVTPFGAYVNFSLDTIYLSFSDIEMPNLKLDQLSTTFMTELKAKDVPIQHVAIDYKQSYYVWHHFLSQHQSLKSISLVANDRCMSHDIADGTQELLLQHLTPAPYRPAVALKERTLSRDSTVQTVELIKTFLPDVKKCLIYTVLRAKEYDTRMAYDFLLDYIFYGVQLPPIEYIDSVKRWDRMQGAVARKEGKSLKIALQDAEFEFRKAFLKNNWSVEDIRSVKFSMVDVVRARSNKVENGE